MSFYVDQSAVSNSASLVLMRPPMTVAPQDLHIRNGLAGFQQFPCKVLLGTPVFPLGKQVNG